MMMLIVGVWGAGGLRFLIDDAGQRQANGLHGRQDINEKIVNVLIAAGFVFIAILQIEG